MMTSPSLSESGAPSSSSSTSLTVVPLEEPRSTICHRSPFQVMAPCFWDTAGSLMYTWLERVRPMVILSACERETDGGPGAGRVSAPRFAGGTISRGGRANAEAAVGAGVGAHLLIVHISQRGTVDHLDGDDVPRPRGLGGGVPLARVLLSGGHALGSRGVSGVAVRGRGVRRMGASRARSDGAFGGEGSFGVFARGMSALAACLDGTRSRVCREAPRGCFAS